MTWNLIMQICFASTCPSRKLSQTACTKRASHFDFRGHLGDLVANGLQAATDVDHTPCGFCR